MMSWEKFFSVGIRLVFVFAFAAFLWASIHHIAAFFHNFEPDSVDWSGSYALAISVDGTALMLTIGMMFFSANMPTHSKVIVWLFIFSLTAFSWVVNWEYAVTYQASTITGHLDPMWKDINPILASSFAFLNLAYSVVAEFFTLRTKSVAELQTELSERIGEKAQLERQLREAKGPGIIAALKGKALEVKAAVKEVINDSDKASPVATSEPIKTEGETEVPTPVSNETEQAIPEVAPIVERPVTMTQREEPITDPELDTANVTTFPHNVAKTTVKLNDIAVVLDINNRRKPLTVSEAMSVLGVSEKTVREWKKTGKLSASADGKSITASSVRRMLESRQERAS